MKRARNATAACPLGPGNARSGCARVISKPSTSRRLRREWAPQVPAYVIGTVAAYWISAHWFDAASSDTEEMQ